MQLENALFVPRSRDGPDGPPGSDFPMSLAVCLSVPYRTIPYRTAPFPLPLTLLSLLSPLPFSSSPHSFSSLPYLNLNFVLFCPRPTFNPHHTSSWPALSDRYVPPTPRVFGYPLTNTASLSPAKYARLSRFLPARTDRQAAIAWGAGEPLSVEDVEVAPPKAHEVRIQINHTGVCHTGQ